MIDKKMKLFQILALITSSFLGIILNLVIGFIIPGLMTYEDFSAYKIYTFYIGFLPILHLGISDGLLLNYSKYPIEELNKFNFKDLLIKFAFIQILLTLLLIFGYLMLDSFNIYHFSVILTIPFVNIAGYFGKLLVLSGKFKVISLLNLIIKLMTVLFIGIMILINYKDYKMLIISMILAYLVQILIGYYTVKKELFTNKSNKLNIQLKFLIKVGLPIVLAYFISTLILGLDRLFIERLNDDYHYAMYSFAYSLITIFIVLLDSVNVVVFPAIMKMSEEIRINYYNYSGRFIDILMGFLSIFVVLLIPIIELFIPKYQDSLQYFFILFPVIFLKLHYSLRIWPQMNTYNKSKTILIVNLIICLFSFLLNLIVYNLKLDINFYGIMTIITLVLLNTVFDIIIRKNERIKFDKKFFYQILIIILFIVTYYNFDYQKFIVFVVVNLILTVVIYLSDFIKLKNIIQQRFQK